MKWTDLSETAANILERCWSIHHDKPLSFSVEIDNPFIVNGQEFKPTEDTYTEIIKYQKSFPYFDVSRIDNRITVSGNCDYGSWD